MDPLEGSTFSRQFSKPLICRSNQRTAFKIDVIECQQIVQNSMETQRIHVCFLFHKQQPYWWNKKPSCTSSWMHYYNIYLQQFSYQINEIRSSNSKELSPSNFSGPRNQYTLSQEKAPKESVISFPYTISKPWAVVIISSHTATTVFTVLGSQWL